MMLWGHSENTEPLAVQKRMTRLWGCLAVVSVLYILLRYTHLLR
jgi:hypothetical protein